MLTRRHWRRIRPLAALVTTGCVCGLTSCVDFDEGDRVTRHLSGRPWGDAIASQTHYPEKWIPEVALAVGAVVAYNLDRHIQDEAFENQPITHGNTGTGTAVDFALVIGAAGIATGDLIGGDDARAIEACAEGLLTTEFITELLKGSIKRDRPNSEVHTSFPSGHTSSAFAAATWIARRMADEGDGWGWKLGYLAYLPAAYVGISRIEGERHFTSDVLTGAFIGMATTNLFYDAHYGDSDELSPGIYNTRGWRLEPIVMDDGQGGLGGGGLAFSTKF